MMDAMEVEVQERMHEIVSSCLRCYGGGGVGAYGCHVSEPIHAAGLRAYTCLRACAGVRGFGGVRGSACGMPQMLACGMLQMLCRSQSACMPQIMSQMLFRNTPSYIFSLTLSTYYIGTRYSV